MMARPGPRRVLIALRVDQELLDAVDDLAAAAQRTRSEQVRTMLASTLARTPAPRRQRA